MIEIKEGMIGLSGGNLFIQKAIRFFTESDFSHSFTIIEKSGVLCAYETTGTVIIDDPVANKLVEDNWVEIWDVIAPEEDKKKALETLRPYVGKWYGYLSYIWFMYRWVCRRFNHNPTKMWWWCKLGITCTEYTVKYPIKLFSELFKDMDINTIAPPELRKIMVANPDKFVCKGWYVPKR